jgi:glycosyltransferase involved in cell wall biosynthesis
MAEKRIAASFNLIDELMKDTMKINISICVITMQRPDELQTLLNSINEIDIDRSLYSVEVIIVDNDPGSSAKYIFEKNQSVLVFPLKYVHQPVRGIPQARNSAIKAASLDCKFIVFVDDDEFVEMDWLNQLVSVQKKTNADVVCGPVYSKFKSQIPNWITEGQFFERIGFNSSSDGEVVHYRKIKTGNLLLRKSLLNQIDGPFDESMALTGGTDTKLALELSKRNAKMVWAANANVYEWVPESRANAKWIIRRAFRTANTEIVIRTLEKNSNQVISVFIEGFLRLSYSSVLLPFKVFQSLFMGKHILIHHLRILYRGAGMMSSCFGYKFNEYATIYK